MIVGLPSALPDELASCPHDRRPGTTVCLHCRHDAFVAAQAKRKRLMLRGAALMTGVGVFVVAGALGATAIRARSNSNNANNANAPQSTAKLVADAPPASKRRVDAAPLSAPTAAPNRQAEQAAAPIVTQQGASAPSTRPPLAPMVPFGSTSLSEGITATRTDSAVLLSFDTEMLRTRRADKFEQFVRTTLPMIYGRRADSVLAGVPEGGIASQGNLLTELPSRGVHIPVADGWTLALWPETRPGQDGPLVIRYRVAIVR